MPARQGGAYAPPAAGGDKGYVLFLREGTLMAQPVDGRTVEVAGEAFPIAEQVGASISNPFFSVSANGVLVHRSGGLGGNNQLVWSDREGKSVGAVGPPGLYTDLALSPDGRRVAAGKRDPLSGNLDIWLIDVEHGVPGRFTFDPATESHPVWSPDASRVVFSSNRSGLNDLYQKGAGGTGADEILMKNSTTKYASDWSADGKYLIFESLDPKTNMDLWVVPDPAASGEHKPKPFLITPYIEIQAHFSPGPAGAQRWVAYTSDESGRQEIYVQPFVESSASSSGKFQVSSAGGNQPTWRRDGKELYYMAPDFKLMAVEVKLSPQFEHGAPKELFQTRAIGAGSSTLMRYAPAPDGKRFLINSVVEESVSAPVTVVLNWTAGLKH